MSLQLGRRAAGPHRIAAHLDRTPHLRNTRALAERVVRIAGIDNYLKELLAAQPDGALVRSLPGVGRSNVSCSRGPSAP
jgi:hypothetical protein